MKKFELMKRVFDICIVLPVYLIISPVLCFLFFMVWFFNGKPILFRQIRPGKNGKPFTIYKFRTMNNRKDSRGSLLPDEKRLTSVGRFLRSTSLDELPELYNVLKGDMSIVGPRPLLMQYIERYSPYQARRHEVKPGITGWAQVNGRNAISWEEKFKYDVWYVDHLSFALDLKILAITILKVLKREGISAKGEATMPEFMGSRNI